MEPLKITPWKVVEEGFSLERNFTFDKNFTLNNGSLNLSGNPEEFYSELTNPNFYIKKTTATNSAKIQSENLSAPNWIGIDVAIDGVVLDLATCEILEYRRELNLREGFLWRTFKAKLPGGKEILVTAQRFLSIADDELGAIRFSVIPFNFSGSISFVPYISADIQNKKTVEKQWTELAQEIYPGEGFILTQNKVVDLQVCTGMKLDLEKDGQAVETTLGLITRENYVANKITIFAEQGQEIILYKYAAVVTSENYPAEKLPLACKLALERAASLGYQNLLEAQAEAWNERWSEYESLLKSYPEADKQNMRFKIFRFEV